MMLHIIHKSQYPDQYYLAKTVFDCHNNNQYRYTTKTYGMMTACSDWWHMTYGIGFFKTYFSSLVYCPLLFKAIWLCYRPYFL